MKTLIIIPAYNEAENIIRTISDIRLNVTNMDYVVINDCSTDNTKELLKNNNINFLNLPINLGIGGGVQTGYQYALEEEYDIAIQFDGDGQHDARYISSLIKPIVSGEADFVIGSRFLQGKGFQSTSIRRLGINFLSQLIQILCKVKVYDVTSGMRAVNKKMIREFAINYAQDYPEPEAVLMAGLKGAHILEIPVEMRERQAGVSSINSLKSIYYMIKVSISLIVLRMSTKRRKARI